MRRLLMLAAFVLSCAHVPPASTETSVGVARGARRRGQCAGDDADNHAEDAADARAVADHDAGRRGDREGGTPPPVVPLQQPKDDFDRTKLPEGGPPPKKLRNLPVPWRGAS